MAEVNLNDIQQVAALALKRAAQILINEFSYDGEDPHGVKRYQEDVDYFNEVAARLEQSKADA
jgi:hypothetical protein